MTYLLVVLLVELQAVLPVLLVLPVLPMLPVLPGKGTKNVIQSQEWTSFKVMHAQGK